MNAQRHLRDVQDVTVADTRALARTSQRPAARLHVAAVQAPAAGPGERARRITPAGIFFVAVMGALAVGYKLPTSAYLSPQSGLGYALGIAGGSAMLLLLLYPVRKRLPQASYLGSTRFWFRAHMTLGILGPALILVHSNFSLGATNSNVALFCMLVVAGSGLFGRYFHSRIHIELHGHRATLDELKEYSGRMRQVTSAVTCLPELARRIDEAQERIERRCERTPLLLRPVASAAWALAARRHLRGTVRAAVAAGADRRHDPSRDSLELSAFRYIDHRIVATRRVVEFEAFERFFSLWHALHMPLFVMLIIAGTVHVVAVHLY
jgi:hypothetical protein